MKRRIMFAATAWLLALGACAQQPTLKGTLGRYFMVGAAVDSALVRDHDPRSAEIVKTQFNSIVAENCMKGEVIHPEVNRYDWTDADRTVEWGERNGQTVYGHCLVWHSQPPKWMFTDEKGDTVSRETLIGRMYSHIMTVVSRYKGRIKGWDVVNEAVLDDGSMRPTAYYKIIGPEYIELAFRFAHEADPEAELYLNDYSMASAGRRNTYCRIIKDLQAKGIRIDAIGMQSHHGYNHPDWNEFEKSLTAFTSLGIKVQFTEIDFNMLPNPSSFHGAEVSQHFDYDKALNPYKDGLTKKAEKLFNQRYLDFFRIVERHKADVKRVTFWGVTDNQSWLNNWPIPGRTNYPLLFDRNYQAKPVVADIIKLFE
jgi:endo-1,4-beta-xylanase